MKVSLTALALASALAFGLTATSAEAAVGHHTVKSQNKTQHKAHAKTTKKTVHHVSAGGSSNVIASVYWSGHTTANGEHYNPDGITAAHKTLPFGTRVKVTNPVNGRSVVTRINDRGPFIAGRTIDLSRGTAHAIGFGGLGKVNMQILGK